VNAVELGAAYASALQRFLAEEDDEGLARAREIGYVALDGSLDATAVVLAHFEATEGSGRQSKQTKDAETSERRRRFLVEALRPFSVTRRHFEQANAELALLNETLLERAKELEVANTELETFNFSVSHDLRTSLQAISGFAQTLATRFGDELAPEARRCLDLILKSTRGMGELINDLLDLSQANRAALDREPVDIGALSRDAIVELESQIADSEVELVVGGLPTVQGDPVLLKRVLVNLLANAIKFTRGKAPARVELDSFERDGEPVIFVRDNGVGFDMKQSDKLFRAFERLHHSEEFEGTGIGLALVERIVDRHGGRVWAESAPGAGATFYFTLGECETVSAPRSAAEATS
jgi:light-regulated signal transduction histidine kinase (bacteriophytochrome)